MSTQSGERKLDTTESTFDPNLDIATVVFSHVQCVWTRLDLALVSKVWRNASKTAAAYPLRFDFDAFLHMEADVDTRMMRSALVIAMMDNDEALSLPYERVVELLGEVAEDVCSYAAMRGSVRLLKWARENIIAWPPDMCHYVAGYGHLPALQYLHENGCPWDVYTCECAAENGHLPALQYSHENGCPWDSDTCSHAAYYKRWDCLQYAVDNKCPGWEKYAVRYAGHLR